MALSDKQIVDIESWVDLMETLWTQHQEDVTEDSFQEWRAARTAFRDFLSDLK